MLPGRIVAKKLACMMNLFVIIGNYIFVHGEAGGNIPYVTAGHQLRFNELHEEWIVYKTQMDALLKSEVSAFNELCKTLKVEHVMLPE